METADERKKLLGQTDEIKNHLLRNIADICKDAIVTDNDFFYPLSPTRKKRPSLVMCDGDGNPVAIWIVSVDQIERAYAKAKGPVTDDVCHLVTFCGNKSGHVLFPRAKMRDVLESLPQPMGNPDKE